MKKMTIIIPIITILMTVILSIFLLDLQQARKYSRFSNLKSSSIALNYNENVKINENIMISILESAENNNVIMQKTNFSTKEKNVKNIYISVSDTIKLYKIISENITLASTHQNTKNINSFISTYNHKNSNQIGLIKDFLNNDFNNYYIFDKLLFEKGNFYGEYVIYYENYNNFNEFRSDVEEIVGAGISSNLITNDLQGYVITTMIVSILVLSIFYFIFQVYDIYYKSQYIGCMKLLGYKKVTILKLLIKNKLKIYTIFSGIVLVSITFLKNITISNFITILILIFIVLLLTYIISLISLNIILNGYNLSDILKKQNIAKKISEISIKLKVIVAVLFVFIFSIFFAKLVPIYENLKEFRNSRDLLEYGVLSTFNPDTAEVYEYDKHIELYKNIVNSQELDSFYAEFNSFDIDEKDEQIAKEQEKIGNYIQYASVDKNYLIKENIVIYDVNGDKIDVKKLDKPFFLFPKSKLNMTSVFSKYYENRTAEDYKNHEINFEFRYYVYDDQKLNSYLLSFQNKYIQSPILRVIDETISLSYVETPFGINVFGTSMETSLKIKTRTPKKNAFDIILICANEAGLKNLFQADSFVEYSDYFADEIAVARTTTIVAIVLITLIILVYIIITLQVFAFYIKSENQKVLVKILLGYDEKKIFSEIVNKNIKYNIITIACSLIGLFFIGKFNVVICLLSILTFLILDFVITLFSIKFHNSQDIYIQLKGGNYD